MGKSAKECSTSTSTLKSWAFHFQKLGLELKCPLCVNLLRRPSLLPCDHIFCNRCLQSSKLSGLECPLCNARYVEDGLRTLCFVENMGTIYRSLDVAFSAIAFQSISQNEMLRVSRELVKTSLEDNLSSGQSTVLLLGDKLQQVRQSQSEVKLGRDSVGDTNQVFQLSPGSPPFSDIRDSKKEISKLDTDESPQKYESLKLGKRSAMDSTRQELHEHSSCGTGDSKRQKILEKAKLNSCSNKVISQGLGASSQPSSVVLGICRKLTKILGESSDAKAVCGFCRSSRITEVTGPIMHFNNGKQVERDEAMLPNTIHVHSVCIEWAPQVYFVDEIVKNLEAELARGAKLKCNKCGMKGAALGCFVKSCQKSYHVPCAVEVSNCRWDNEDFLLLCPAHTYCKFPREKSKSGKRNLKPCPSQTQIASQQPEYWAGRGSKEWVFCGSALSPEEKGLLVEFGNMMDVPVTKFWKPNVTHVIASTDADGTCIRTLKVLMAILHGRWVVAIDWVKACMQSKHLVDEEQYEVSLDNHGCIGGPKTGRLSALNDEPRLFHGLSFYFAGDFVPGYKEDLFNLVVEAGGFILESEEKLAKTDDHSTQKSVIVYNVDPPEGCKLGEEVSITFQRLSDSEDLAAKYGSLVIGHTWILESIAAYKLQPFVGCNSVSKVVNLV